MQRLVSVFLKEPSFEQLTIHSRDVLSKVENLNLDFVIFGENFH